MLLTQHQTHNEHQAGASGPLGTEEKKHFSKWAVLSFWIGLLILINIVIAAWINTQSQFAVESDDASVTQKVIRAMEIRKQDIFKKLLHREKPAPAKPQEPRAVGNVPAFGTAEPPANSQVQPEQNSAAGSFDVRELLENFKDRAGELQLPTLGTKGDGIGEALGGTDVAVPSMNGINQFAETAAQFQRLAGTANRITGIALSDEVLEVAATQVLGVSAFSAGRETPNGYKEYMMIADAMGKLYDQVGTPVVSPDGKSIAYLAMDGNIMKLVQDGREIAAYKDFGPSVYDKGQPLEGQRFLEAAVPEGYLRNLTESALAFTPDGKLVYTAWKSKKPLVVVNGVEGPQFDVVQEPVISPDGSRIAYVVGQGLNIAGELTTPGGCTTEECVRIFTDMAGRQLKRRAYTYFAVADGVMSVPYDEILDLVYSENSKGFGFLGRRDDRWYTVINGKEGSPYDEVRGLAFSPDGSEYAFAARTGNVWSLVKNGAEIAKLGTAVGDTFLYDFASDTFAYADPTRKFFVGDAVQQQAVPGFFVEMDPTGKQAALLRKAGADAQVVLYDIASGVETAGEPAASVVQSLFSAGASSSKLEFSPDGMHSAYPLNIQVDGAPYQQMVIDGVRQLPYASVGNPVFSPDGLLVAYAATALDPLSGVERALAVINGRETELYDRILGELQLSLDGKSVRYLAERNGALEWVTHSALDSLPVASLPVQKESLPPSPFPGLFCPPEAVFKDLDLALQNPLSVCGLSMPDGGRTALPAEVGTLIYLKHLNLSFNEITALPDSIGNLYDLRWLSLVGNSVEVLPESITQLSRLEYLDVSSNKLSSLPQEFGSLNNLRILNVSANNLTSLPSSMGSLRKLERLYVNGNSIPQDMLTSLQGALPDTRIYGL